MEDKLKRVEEEVMKYEVELERLREQKREKDSRLEKKRRMGEALGDAEVGGGVH